MAFPTITFLLHCRYLLNTSHTLISQLLRFLCWCLHVRQLSDVCHARQIVRIGRLGSDTRLSGYGELKHGLGRCAHGLQRATLQCVQARRTAIGGIIGHDWSITEIGDTDIGRPSGSSRQQKTPDVEAIVSEIVFTSKRWIYRCQFWSR